MSARDPDDNRCAWCDRRVPARAMMDHERAHWLADIAIREAGVTLKDSRAMGESLAATVEIEEQRRRGEMLARVLP